MALILGTQALSVASWSRSFSGATRRVGNIRASSSGGARFELGSMGGPIATREPGKPFIVGVAGGTASGKTAVVKRIVAALNEQSVAVMPQVSTGTSGAVTPSSHKRNP